jgi:hypothetical protein
MNKLFPLIVISLLIFACKKEKEPVTLLDDTCEVSFTLDGKKYTKTLAKNEFNQGGGFGLADGHGGYTQTQSVTFEIDSILEIEIELGCYNRKGNDSIDNYAINQKVLQQFLSTGQSYKCLTTDTSIKNGVDINISEKRKRFWRSYKTDWVNYKPIPITNEQTGSSFVITEVKEVSTDGQRHNAFIIKGSFNCNVYDERTDAKRVLTDGTFTLLILG